MSALSRGLAPRMNPLSPKRSATIAVLDIGTRKVTCAIARLKPLRGEVIDGRSHSIDVLGLGQVRANGIKAGAVADLARAEESVRQAVSLAEQMAGVEIASVVLALSGGRIGGESFSASVQLNGPSVEQHDIAQVLDAASLHSIRDGRAVLHSLPVNYALDGNRGIREPRGMLANDLAVDLHVVTADLPALRNLVLCVERCHLTVEGVVAAPYAAGLSVLTGDEAELGATVIEFGAGTTTLAAFVGGHCVHVDGIALGGQHITTDLARGLSLRLSDAERLKILHGSVIGYTSDDHDMISVPAFEGDIEAPDAVARSRIVAVTRPRAEEILELLRERMKEAGVFGEPSRQIVLTGAGAELTGLADLVSRMFGRTARIGRPFGVSGLKDWDAGPGFAVAAGLLVYPQYADREHFEPRRRRAGEPGGYFIQMGRWLRESF
ncbi:MAG TPA: cell division protein FtsA [Xanthobacteraceae bacterium]|nr:cell division protein FtsA [Xanthobacteraceae bacterium]